MHRGVATFTLDTGKCPKWLFERMVKLGREMTRVLIEEYGPDEYIARLADPIWFQALGTVLAFDWNASGLTTILTAALKEAIRGQERQFGVFICGGKGATSRKTPDEILRWGEWLALPETAANNLVYNSKMSAKVDSALIQDGFQLYHHSFIFSRNGAWTVVQQGMNAVAGTARRYHWHSRDIKDLIVEPHTGIVSDPVNNRQITLNMTAKEGDRNRTLSTDLVAAGYKTLINDIELLRKHTTPLSNVVSLRRGQDTLTVANLAHHEFKTHSVIIEDFSKSRYLEKILQSVTNASPRTYEEFVAHKGVGPKTVRALALVAELIYGAPAAYTDPARYSFAHGGKDATPYPVDRSTYDRTISAMRTAVGRSRLSLIEKQKISQRLL